MSSFSAPALIFKSFFTGGQNRRAIGGLFFALGVLGAVFIAVSIARAGVPAYSSGGPPDGQSFVPPDALVDINANEALIGATVNQSSVTLLQCTGTTEPTSCPQASVLGIGCV